MVHSTDLFTGEGVNPDRAFRWQIAEGNAVSVGSALAARHACTGTVRPPGDWKSKDVRSAQIRRPHQGKDGETLKRRCDRLRDWAVPARHFNPQLVFLI